MKKKKHFILILRIIAAIVTIFCIVVFTPWDGIWTWLEPLPDTVQEQVNKATNHGLDGIIVYVDEADKAPAFYTAGWKNRVDKVPADPQALFKIASISKLYIATAAAKLVYNKRLSLDDTLANYLPELVERIENADRITLRMLLQHRSGIPNFIDDDEFDWPTTPTNIRKSLELVLDEPADFEPDTDYRYSNTNYLFIGLILDKVLGYSHQQYINREILVPLGLIHTYGSLSQVDLGDVVSGYTVEYDGDLKGMDFVVPGGSMVATAQDLGIFLRALNDGSLLNDDEQVIYSSIYKYEHTGLLPGYYSIARYYKDIDTVVVQFVNTTGGNTIMTSDIIYDRIVQILHR